MKNILIVIGLLLIYTVVRPEEPNLVWEGSFGGEKNETANSIEQTMDGGYIVAGWAASENGDVAGNHGLSDYWLLKFDGNMNLEWKKCFGGSSSDKASCVRQTADGGYIVVGESNSKDGDIVKNRGSYDLLAIKTDARGNLTWEHCFGGTNVDLGKEILLTDDGGCIIIGKTYSNDVDVTGNHGCFDAWVIKMDRFGNVHWQKCFGGAGNDEISSLIKTRDGGYLAAGRTDSKNDDMPNNGNWDAWIIKFDADFNIVTQKCIGGIDHESAVSTFELDDGSIAIAGSTCANNDYMAGLTSYYDYWLIMLNSNLEKLWEKSFGGTFIDKASCAIRTKDGCFIIAGYTGSTDGHVSGALGAADYWAVKVSQVGKLIWQKVLGGKGFDRIQNMIETNDGHLLFAGESQSLEGNVTKNNGGYDIWLAKMSSTTAIDDNLPMLTDHDLAVYPNPAGNTIFVRNQDYSEGDYVRIFDILGNEVLRNKVIGEVTGIDISGLPESVYFIGQEGRMKAFVKE